MPPTTCIIKGPPVRGDPMLRANCVTWSGEALILTDGAITRIILVIESYYPDCVKV